MDLDPTDAEPSPISGSGLLGRPPRWGLEEEASHERVAAQLFGHSRPRTIGRYVIGERLGVGGMGEVWAAHDPMLNRAVALKTVRTTAFATVGDRSGLIEEARVLARLRHDHVLSVHDVLEHDELVVIVMERVTGEALGSWSRREDVDREQVMVALEAAAQGLIAAHAAGVSHLDFKPANVLVGRDGRVLVADFGLACVFDRPRASFGGTPGFAAPEQWRSEGAVPGPRADQFAFASTLCSLLGGGAAIGRDDPTPLDDDGFCARVRAAVEATKLGRHQRRALMRALARRPDDRWPSMQALADALFVRPRQRTRRIIIMGGLALALGVGVGMARLIDAPQACGGIEAQQWLREAWEPGQRDAFLRTAAAGPDLEPGAVVASARLDAYRHELALMWPRVCEVELVDVDDQDAMAVRRCVERKRRELVAVARMLVEPSPRVIERAPLIVADIGSVADCDLAIHGRPAQAWSAEQLGEVGRIHVYLAEARVHRHAGDRAAQRAALLAAAELAAALDDASLRAEVDQALGHMAVEDGEIDAGLALVEQAYFAAMRGGDELLAADTANLLVFLAGSRGSDVERGKRWAEHADAQYAKLDVDEVRSARLLAHQGALFDTAGDAEASLNHYRQALELIKHADAPALEIVALNGVAIGLESTGDAAGALRTYAELEPIVRAEYGDHHPRYGVLANNIGAARQAVGEFELAIEWHERARVIADRQGLDRLRLSALINLCFAHGSARHGPKALPSCRAAVALCLDVYPGASLRCDSAYMGLGNNLAATGAGEQALAAYRQVFDDYTAGFDPDDPMMAWAWSSLGAGQVAVGAWPEARDAYERAAKLAADGNFPAAEVAEIEFGLAKAWHGLGRSEQARSLAESAAAAYAEAGHVDDEREVRGWLAALPTLE